MRAHFLGKVLSS